ncbi:MAG: hypothetical protein K2P18_05185 [Oscillospiraceae bacterium]|nr:hypothetical protein [Oscillospiraceae bacterium]
MNYGLYDAVVRWAEHTGGSMDEGLFFVGFAWFIAIVVLCWAFNFTADLGYNIYQGMRELFCAILRRVRRKKDEGP